MIPGHGDVGFAADGVFHARPPDLHDLGRIEIVVFDAAQEVIALGQGANAQRVRRVNLPDVFVAGINPDRPPRIPGSGHNGLVVGNNAIYGVSRVDQIGPHAGASVDWVCIDAVGGRLILPSPTQTGRPQQGVQYADRLIVALPNDV